MRFFQILRRNKSIKLHCPFPGLRTGRRAVHINMVTEIGHVRFILR